MTYTFKLSRRLARLRGIAAIAGALLTLSCTDANGPGSTPTATDPTSVVIAPESISIGANQTVQFQAATDSSTAVSFATSKARGRWKVVRVTLSPLSSSVVPGSSQSFNATATLNDGSIVQPSLVWTATGGRVDVSGKYTAGKVNGKYRVIATASNGVADTAVVSITTIAPILAQILLSPASISLPAGGSQQFAAEGKSADSATVSVTPTYTATGGTISSAGVYTAGQTSGSFWVIATDSATGVADTSGVTIISPATTPPATTPPATLQAVVLTPTTISLAAGGTQQFTASGRMTDGSTSAVTVTWSASGGTISSAGLYNAGQTAGSYRVIATESGGTLADTAGVTITAPPPDPSGQTFFVADAESGTVTPPWDGPVFANHGLVPVTSTAEAKNGSRSFKFEIPPTTVISSSTVMALRPQASMSGTSGHFESGYYSFWAYVDAGFNNTSWNMILGWMTGVSGAPSPINYIGLENWTNNGQSRGGSALQLVFLMKNCGATTFACPVIPGYANGGSEWYRQTSASPNGVTPFPRNQWVHLSVYYKMAASNGQVTIWQDGVKIMDLTAPTMNTFVGHTTNSNAAGDMVLQSFIYGGAENTTRRMYIDDFKVTDFPVVP